MSKGYTQITVIVDGALDAEHDIEVGPTAEAEVQAIIDEASREASLDGLSTDVYILYHAHPNDGDECACVQYLIDHSPAYTFP